MGEWYEVEYWQGHAWSRWFRDNPSGVRQYKSYARAVAAIHLWGKLRLSVYRIIHVTPRGRVVIDG